MITLIWVVTLKVTFQTCLLMHSTSTGFLAIRSSLIHTWSVHTKYIRVISTWHEKRLEIHVALTLGIPPITSKSRTKPEGLLRLCSMASWWWSCSCSRYVNLSQSSVLYWLSKVCNVPWDFWSHENFRVRKMHLWKCQCSLVSPTELQRLSHHLCVSSVSCITHLSVGQSQALFKLTFRC